MTSPTQEPQTHEDLDDKPQRGFEPDELPAVYVALGVGLLAVVLAIVTYVADEVAIWPMGLGAAVVLLGLWGGIRGAVGSGALLMAIGSMVLTRDWSLEAALLTNAVVIVLCMVVLLGADMSFVMRRGSRVAPETVQGLARTHALALVVGIVAATVVVGIVEAITWPSWLIVLPIIGLTLAALWMVRGVRSYRTAVRQADAPVVGRGPATHLTPADTSWRQLKWNSGAGS